MVDDSTVSGSGFYQKLVAVGVAIDGSIVLYIM